MYLCFKVNKGVILPVGIKDSLDKMETHQHTNKSLQKVKRRRSEGSELLSNMDVKRRCSSGGEKAAALGVSVDMGSKMRPVGNTMKSRKSNDKIHEGEERPKTVSSVAVIHVAPDDQLKDRESSSLFHKSDIHHTGSIKEEKSGEVHLMIKNEGNIDALLPGPENVPSSTEGKLHSSVDCCVAKDVNEASSGHSTNMDENVSTEKCIEHADVPLNTVERVAELRIESAGGSVTTIRTVPVLRVKTVRHSACGEQNPLGNQHDTVRSSRSEPRINLLQCGRETITDSASDSQVLSISAITEQIQNQILGRYAGAGFSKEGCKEKKESEQTILPDNVCVPKSIAQTYQLSSSLNNMSHYVKVEATGSGKKSTEASSGHSTIQVVVPTEQHIEHADVSLNAVAGVTEMRVESAGGSGTRIRIENVLRMEETVRHSACGEQNPLGNQLHFSVPSVEGIEHADVSFSLVGEVIEVMVESAGGDRKIFQIIPVLRMKETVAHSACGEQNPLGNQHDTVRSSRIEPRINLLQCGRGTITDSASDSQVLNMSAITEQIQNQTLERYADAVLPDMSHKEGCKEMEENEGTILPDNVCVPKSIAQSYQLSASLNNMSTYIKDEATGSG